MLFWLWSGLLVLKGTFMHISVFSQCSAVPKHFSPQTHWLYLTKGFLSWPAPLLPFPLASVTAAPWSRILREWWALRFYFKVFFWNRWPRESWDAGQERAGECASSCSESVLWAPARVPSPCPLPRVAPAGLPKQRWEHLVSGSDGTGRGECMSSHACWLLMCAALSQLLHYC